MTNKERMLNLVLGNKDLQEMYGYSQRDYEDLYTAYNSDNIVVATVARIIKDLNGATDESSQKKVYMSLLNYLNENFLYDN